jgi:hypothetical protein
MYISFKPLFPIRLSDQNSICVSDLCHACYMPRLDLTIPIIYSWDKNVCTLTGMQVIWRLFHTNFKVRDNTHRKLPGHYRIPHTKLLIVHIFVSDVITVTLKQVQNIEQFIQNSLPPFVPDIMQSLNSIKCIFADNIIERLAIVRPIVHAILLLASPLTTLTAMCIPWDSQSRLVS